MEGRKATPACHCIAQQASNCLVGRVVSMSMPITLYRWLPWHLLHACLSCLPGWLPCIKIKLQYYCTVCAWVFFFWFNRWMEVVLDASSNHLPWLVTALQLRAMACIIQTATTFRPWASHNAHQDTKETAHIGSTENRIINLSIDSTNTASYTQVPSYRPRYILQEDDGWIILIHTRAITSLPWHW